MVAAWRKWLGDDRTARLGAAIAEAIVKVFGRAELLQRLEIPILPHQGRSRRLTGRPPEPIRVGGAGPRNHSGSPSKPLSTGTRRIWEASFPHASLPNAKNSYQVMRVQCRTCDYKPVFVPHSEV